MWDVSRFPVVAAEERETAFAAAEEEGDEDGGGTDAENVNLEEQFRAALAKLTACGSVLGPLPPGCTFTVAVELKEEAEAPIGHPQPWIPMVPSLQATKKEKTKGEQTRGEDLGGAKTTPVRAVRAGEMVFELWIEEGKAKREMNASALNTSLANSI